MNSQGLAQVLVVLAGLTAIERPLIGSETVLALTHANLIDATGAPAKSDCTVLITNDRISAVGGSGELHPPTNAVVFDATGKFLIPGLWDMHVHWYDTDWLPLFIANGVTGVRIMWGLPTHHEWRRRIESGSLLGPRLFIASGLVDGPKPTWPGSIIAGNAVEGQEAVRKAVEEGLILLRSIPRYPAKHISPLRKNAGSSESRSRDMSRIRFPQKKLHTQDKGLSSTLRGF